jgi:outer membrane protein OmpA-like peptidoglycan-associated protein
LVQVCNVKGAFIAAYSDDSKLELRSAIRELHSIPAEIRSESSATPEIREIINKTTLFFPFDDYKPAAMELNKIDDLLSILKNHSNYLVEVDGYTDIQGSKDYNYGLAAERAKYVKDYLISSGIDHTRITDHGYGEKHLRKVCYQDCTPSIHRENRRVEIIIYINN